ncbi:DUF58 domain-containing protein [Micromonospora musae]|uniref:DUF58 domain-containing protein n=1 Tax=Micromonospora musae TaxID=1894970 RepID=UPI0033C1DA8B
MHLTRRGRAVLVLAVALLAAGVWGRYPFPAGLGAVGLGAVLAAVLLTARGLPVEVRRSVYPDRVERGRPALARLAVRNPGGRRQAGFEAVDAVGGAARTVRVRALPPGAEAVHHYELPTGVRGRFTIGPLTLHRADPFGLAHHASAVGGVATLRVHPRQRPARALAGGHPRHHHEGADDALRGSAELQDVREYIPGDEVRHLHWKATARTGRLMVRDHTDPDEPRLTLLLDTRAGGLPAGVFEEAVELAASLLGAAARAGHHTRLVTSSGLDLPQPGGAPAARQLLDELCELRQDACSAELVPALLPASRPGGGYLVVVTGPADAPVALAGLRERFPAVFLFVLSDPDAGGGGPIPTARAGAGSRVFQVDGAAEAVRRWNEVIG